MPNESVIIDTPEGIAFYLLAQLKSALKLEMAGIRVWRNASAYAIAKKKYGLRGNRAKVLAELTRMVEEAIAARQSEHGPDETGLVPPRV